MLILETLSYLVSYWNNVGCDRRLQTVDTGWLRLIDGRSFSLLRTTCEGDIVFVLMGLLLPGVCTSCRCLRRVRVRLFCVPGVAVTRSQYFLSLLTTCESEIVLYSWGCVRQVPLSNCYPLVHMYCFPVGDLLPIGIVIPVEGGKRWVSSCAGWKRFSSSIVFCFIVYILSCCVCLGCTLYIVQDFLSW